MRMELKNMELSQSHEEKARRLHRMLNLVRLGHGTLTVRQAERLTGWGDRMLQRYVAELDNAGLITHGEGKRNCGVRWTITPAGLTQLQGDLLAHQD